MCYTKYTKNSSTSCLPSQMFEFSPEIQLPLIELKKIQKNSTAIRLKKPQEIKKIMSHVYVHIHLNNCNVWHAFLKMPLDLKGNRLRTARYRCMENGTWVGGAGHAHLSAFAKVKQWNDGANSTDLLGHYLQEQWKMSEPLGPPECALLSNFHLGKLQFCT